MVFALGNSGTDGTFPIRVKYRYQFGATFPTRMQGLEAEMDIATCWADVRMVPGARFAPFAPRNSHSQLRHDIHFNAMYEFSVPQPIALFAYGHIGPNRDGRIRRRLR